MIFPIHTISPDDFPLLRETPHPPKKLYIRGTPPPKENHMLAVVGSRDYSNYGKQCVTHLIEKLAGYPVTIVSGLALGIDALAHEAALRAHLHTIAIPGSGLENGVLYPRKNRDLAQRILESGGALISEYEPESNTAPWMFPQRNRIIAGISHGTLLIEAKEKSGTLITARLTADYNREVLVVPGNIFMPGSVGVHQFLKLGATPVTDAKDILNVLGIEEHDTITTNRLPIHTFEPNTPEATIMDTLAKTPTRDELIRTLTENHDLDTAAAGVLLMKLELQGLIKTIDDRLVAA